MPESIAPLIRVGRLFLCHHCSGLFHYSKNEGFWDRSLRQRTKHRRRLRDENIIDIPSPFSDETAGSEFAQRMTAAGSCHEDVKRPVYDFLDDPDRPSHYARQIIILLPRGASTGPKTEQGRKRCAEAKFVHGWETRELRVVRAEKFREIKS